MIEFISHSDIDKPAYDRCIKASVNSRIYALSWYLDAVARGWDLLALDGYQAVMPLPRRRKYGLSYVYTPAFVQQLGVFYGGEIDQNIECEFYAKARSKYFLMDYFAHSSSSCIRKPHERRINYILNLKSDLPVLEKGFNDNRRRIVKKGFKGLRIDREGDRDLFIRMCRETDMGYKLNKETREALERLIKSNGQMIRVWNVFIEESWAGGLVWASDQRRITYLFPLTNSLGKNSQVPTFILHSLIKEHQGRDLLLDLEGSMIEGVAQFYRSFGAGQEVYYHFKSRFYGLF